MAILTSAANKEDKFKIYDVPDSELEKFEVTGDKAATMFPQGEAMAEGIPTSEGSMGAARIDNANSLGDVQAYNSICVCWVLRCDSYGYCWRHYYYCYC